MRPVRFLLLWLVLLLAACEEAQIIAPFAIYSAAVSAGGATVTVEYLKKECNEKPTRHEVCTCWARKLSRLATPFKCWTDDSGNYLNPA